MNVAAKRVLSLATGLRTVDPGAGYIFAVAPLAVPAGVQLLASVGTTPGQEHLRDPFVPTEAGHHDRVGQQLGEGHQLSPEQRRSICWVLLANRSPVQCASHLV